MDKNKNLVFLGHHNYGLALLVDNIYENIGTDCSIQIIHNQAIEENPIQDAPFSLPETKINNIQLENWKPKENDSYFLTPISPESRIKLFNHFNKEKKLKVKNFAKSLHPSAIISKSSRHGIGLYMGSSTALSAFSNVGDHVIIMRNSVVGHHSKIEDFVTISGGVIVAGNVHIKSGVFIFAGVTLFDGVTVGQNSRIGAGSVVTKSIPDNVIAYGNPCKVIRKRD